MFACKTFAKLHGIKMIAASLFFIHWFSSLFCQSFFLHRYCSHRMFKMSFFWERFFYFLTYLSQGPSFLNPTSYSIMHQRHHAHSDTDKDPHSPHHNDSMWSMMLNTYHEYKDLIKTHHLVNDSVVVHKSPQWKRLDEFAETGWNTLLWSCVYLSIYILFEIELVYYIFLPLHFLVGPIQGAIVNWFGHKIGYRNFELQDKSRNSLPIDLALMGELYQNNHHKNGFKFNFAHRWFEIDLTYQMAKILKFLGIIQLREIRGEAQV